MHIPDGFINAGTSVGAGALAIGGLAYCLRRSADDLDDRAIPLAGLVAAFVFAAQMVNFPVAGGTSGHLLGGTLAAVLVGPRLGAVVVSVVLGVQTFLFADGGISALGLNIVNMALVTSFAGYGIFLLVRRVLPGRPSSIPLASGIAAGLAVIVSSLAFTVEYAIGGAGGASLSTVLGAMVGVHVLIGIGEGVITALTVSAVMASRPDLVHGASELPIDLGVESASPAGVRA